jgi:hypothetical protein
MTRVEEIEKALERLAPAELAKFRAWYEEFDSARCDAAIEPDTQTVALDGLADEALAGHRIGQSREL